jgi:GNAT superfamily N-acetyltransferase
MPDQDANRHVSGMSVQLENRAARQLVACQHHAVNQVNLGQLRAARADDIAQLLSLWGLLYNEVDPASTTPWKGHAREWFARSVDDNMSTRIPVIAVGGELVATAIGTIEIGVPNPHCPKGRTVRLANLITLPEHRGQSYATMLVRDVIAWARTVHADRVDLSATPEGQRIYEHVGFAVTSAPRMKLAL